MTTTFSVTAADIINQAVLQQGWLDYTQTINSTKQGQMFTVLQMLVKRWGSKGLKLWVVEDLTLPFVSGQTTYSIGPSGNVVANRPLRIEYALIRYISTTVQNRNDIQLFPLARTDYEMLGNKFSPGVPNSYFFDPQLINAQISFYNTPNDFAATTYECHLFVRNQLDDIPNVNTAMAFPQEWYDALVWGLAYETRLMNKVPQSMYTEIRETYMNFLKDAEDWDREYTDYTFGVDLSQAYGPRNA